jgi:hypothetical protein
VKSGRVAQTKKDNILNKRQRKEKMMPLQKTMNVNQHVVDRHLVDIPQSNTQSRYRNENASTSKNPDAFVLGNHETSTAYNSGEVYDQSTTIVNPCFLTIIAENFLVDSDPKTMTECITHLRREKCSLT